MASVRKTKKSLDITGPRAKKYYPTNATWSDPTFWLRNFHPGTSPGRVWRRVTGNTGRHNPCHGPNLCLARLRPGFPRLGGGFVIGRVYPFGDHSRGGKGPGSGERQGGKLQKAARPVRHTTPDYNCNPTHIRRSVQHPGAHPARTPARTARVPMPAGCDVRRPIYVPVGCSEMGAHLSPGAHQRTHASLVYDCW
jgi:hypothetical protein